MSFAEWRKRRASRAAKRAGDKDICPYCRTVHPAHEVGGSPRSFGYPSVKFGCCGRVAFQYKDPHSGQLLGYIRIGDGEVPWMPKDAYFAWVEEQNKARGKREGTPHGFARGEPSRRPKAQSLASLKAAAEAQAKDDVPAPAPGAVEEPEPPGLPSWDGYLAVAKVDEVKPGDAKMVEVQGYAIALFNVGGQFRAVQNTCPHAGRPLVAGTVDDGVVTCAGHGWMFDLATGKNVNDPDSCVPHLPVKVEDGKVLVAKPETTL